MPSALVESRSAMTNGYRRRCAGCTLAVAVIYSVQPAVAQHGEAPPAAAPVHVTIRGRTYQEYPPQRLRDRGFSIPDVAEDRNAAWTYIEAYNARTELPDDLAQALQDAAAGNWPAGETAERLSAWLDENRPALDLARRAALMPESRMPLFGKESEPLIMIVLPALGEHRMLTRALAADSDRKLRQGDAAGAAENVLTVQRMSNHVAAGCTLIEHLVGIACSTVAADALTRLSEAPGIDAALLSRTAGQFGELDAAFPSWERALQSEATFSTSFIEDLANHPALISMLLNGELMAHGGFPPRPAPDQLDGWARLVVRVQQVFLPDRAARRHMRRFYDDVVAAAGSAPGKPAALDVQSDELERRIPAWNAMARILLPSLNRSYQIATVSVSNRRRAMLTALTRAFAGRHGRPPATLAELMPEFLPAIPIDPLTGAPFEYVPGATSGESRGLEQLTVDRQPRRAAAPSAANASAPSGAAAADSSAGPAAAPEYTEPTEWRRFVDEFAAAHRLNESQNRAALGVLNEMEARAADFDRVHGARLNELRLRLAGASDEPLRGQLSRDLDPLQRQRDGLFDELRRRLDTLLTAEQRAAAASQATR